MLVPHRCLFVLLVLAASGCSASPISASVPAPRSEPKRQPIPRYALLWSNAFVRTSSLPSATKARMKRYADEDRADRIGDVWPVEVLEERAESLRVRTLGANDADHCYRGPTAFNALSVELFVERRDVAEATTQPQALTFDDGTAVFLNAGVALSPVAQLDQAPMRRVGVDGFTFALLANRVDAGSFYEHAPRFDERGVTLETRDALRFAENEVVHKDAVESFPLLSAGARSGPTDATLLTGCLELRGRLEGDREVVPHVPVEALDAATTAAPKGAKHFAIGTQLYFTDGRVAGRLVDAMALSLLEPQGDKLCFQRSLAEPDDGEPMPTHHRLEFCFSRADARELPQPRHVSHSARRAPIEAAPASPEAAPASPEAAPASPAPAPASPELAMPPANTEKGSHPNP